MSTIDLRGLANQPTPWRVYEFFAEGGGFTMPRPMGLVAQFSSEDKANDYVKANQTHRITYRIVNQAGLPKPDNTLPPPRLIVCAAMLMKDGLIVTGVRHFSPEMRAVLKRLYGDTGYHKEVVEQGFIDQFGAFLTRGEAWKIASERGQIRKRVGGDEADGGTLYSENCW